MSQKVKTLITPMTLVAVTINQNRPASAGQPFKETKMQPNEILIKTGETLYGERWQTQIAKDLGLSDRHLRRMVAGTAEFKPTMAFDLHRILLEREQDIADLIPIVATFANVDTSL